MLSPTNKNPLPDINELGVSKRHITLGGGGVGIHTLNLDYSLSALWTSGKIDNGEKTSIFGGKNNFRNNSNL